MRNKGTPSGNQRCQSSSRCPFLSKLPSLTRHLGNFQVNVSDGRLGLCGILIGHLDTLTNDGNSARCGRCRCIKDCLKLLSYGSLRFLIPSFGIKKKHVLSTCFVGATCHSTFLTGSDRVCGPCCWDNPRCSPRFAGEMYHFFMGQMGQRPVAHLFQLQNGFAPSLHSSQRPRCWKQKVGATRLLGLVSGESMRSQKKKELRIPPNMQKKTMCDHILSNIFKHYLLYMFKMQPVSTHRQIYGAVPICASKSTTTWECFAACRQVFQTNNFENL